ncbi:unnamed protein product [Ambrosiozyma monospora]|uniref:Unnamed protein product n=1 Tax=Ambrosiozyma monospora TaxID=43982 RepID=A0ACB5U1E3_AMBMO|nr:unnamed protein product [Ambrosiozyma monospora]
MIGKEMESFMQGFEEELGKDVDLDLKEPMLNQWDRVDVLKYSFGSFISQVTKSLDKYYGGEVPKDDKVRARLCWKVQEMVFQHMIRKVVLAMNKLKLKETYGVNSLVCSGGVGANLYLRQMLRDQVGEAGIENFYFPEPRLCTDNSTMVGWAGIELYEAGYTTELGTSVIRKWPVDQLLELDGWIKK